MQQDGVLSICVDTIGSEGSGQRVSLDAKVHGDGSVDPDALADGLRSLSEQIGSKVAEKF